MIPAFQKQEPRRRLGFVILLALLQLPSSAAAQTPSADSLYNDAGQAHDRGDIAKAISLYEALIQLQPQSVEARTNLGVALAHVGRYDEAIAQYCEALKYAPQNPMVRLNLALAWYKEADFAKAADELTRLRADHPEGQQSLYLLADCLLRLGKNHEAVVLLQPVYDTDPDDRAVDCAWHSAHPRWPGGQGREGHRPHFENRQ